MDEPIQEANDQVGGAPDVIPEEKSGKAGKREGEEPLVEEISVKKQKVEADVKKVNAPPPEEESTSTEEDTCPESEEKPKSPVGDQNGRRATTIFIANLPSKIDEDDLATFFKEAGEVIEVKFPRFAHVEFATEEAAKKALEMNHKEFMGHELRVSAKQKDSSTSDSRKDNSSNRKGEDEGTDVVMKDAPSVKSSGKAKSNKEPKAPAGNQNERGLATIFVGNLSFKVDEEEIASFFKEAGEVIDVRLARSEDNRLKGFCHVEFATQEAAKKALEMNQEEFMGRPLRIDLAQPKVSYSPHGRKDNSSNRKGEKRGGHRFNRGGRSGDRGRGRRGRTRN